MGSGFPDFVCFKHSDDHRKAIFHLKFVEAKMTGILDKKEKLKLNYLINRGQECFVARKEGREIIYEEFLGYKPK